MPNRALHTPIATARRRTAALPARLLGVVLAATIFSLQPGAGLADEHETLRQRWAIAEFGEPGYDESLTHWPYADPDAVRGGTVVLGSFGTFDSLNPYILKGNPAFIVGATMDTLMTGSSDELLSMYGLIAKSVAYPADKRFAVFTLRQDARYDDDVRITAADFKLTFDTIREHGRPFLRAFYRDVEGVEVLSEHLLKFTFKTRNSMKPIIQVAGLAPSPRHHWKDRDISRTTLEPWPSSGAYRITKVDAGRSITFERVASYWGDALPVNRGLNNFATMRYDYYRDLSVMFEAFKAGQIDFRMESSSKRWATEYDFTGIRSGAVLRETPPSNQPEGIQGLLMNTRRPQFADVRVREGLGRLFDFEWTRKALLYNQYTRTASYFPNSDYGASGPPSAAELAVLEPHRAALPPAVLSKAFEPPVTDASGRSRKELRAALALFSAAGWRLEKGKLLDAAGQQMRIEILLVQPDFERLLSPYVANLNRAGIDASIRIVDTSQYQNRTDDFDFDMVNVKFNFFPPPGAELRSFYGSAAADQRGSANMAGIKDPVVDALIEAIVSADDLEGLKVRSRALDRVLLWQHYMIPEWHNAEFRIAFWNRFGRPQRLPKYGTGFPSTWWVDPALDAALNRGNQG